MTEVPPIICAEMLIGCHDLDPSLAFYESLGFAVAEIFPADDPTEAVLTGHGLRLRLCPAGPGGGHIRLTIEPHSEPSEMAAPEGTVIQLVPEQAGLDVPPLIAELDVVDGTADAAGPDSAGSGGWTIGRAGMHYRDLMPGRQGGRFIASHIRIPAAGPVPDYVHHHQIRFQMIFCRRGWVRLVYQHQGVPFVLEPGDCVLQPPGIRHQVLEASDGLEVVELGCPAVHRTRADPTLALPDTALDPDHDFGGQRFVHHRAQGAPWQPHDDRFEGRPFGFASATDGLAEAWVLRPVGSTPGTPSVVHDDELHFTFVVDGQAVLHLEDGERLLPAGAAATVPAGMAHGFAASGPDTRLLRVVLPA